MINEEFEHNYKIIVKQKDGKLSYTLLFNDKFVMQETFRELIVPRGILPSIVKIFSKFEEGQNVGYSSYNITQIRKHRSLFGELRFKFIKFKLKLLNVLFKDLFLCSETAETIEVISFSFKK